MKPILSLEHRIRALAESVGLAPDVATNMTFLEFSRAVAMRRAVRDSQRIALAVAGRRTAVAS
jgi:hypothetical protein